MIKDIHPVLLRQLKKADINLEGLADKKFIYLIERISLTYDEADKSRYLTERAMKMSSLELRSLYESIKHEKNLLESALTKLVEKDKVINKKNKNLIKQKNYSSSIIQSIPDILIIINTHMVIVDVNDTTVNRIKIPKEKIIGAQLNVILKDISPIKNRINHAELLNDSNIATNFKSDLLIDKGETSIPVLISISPVVESNSKVERLICIAKDITELVNLERENAERLALLAHAGRLASLGEMATSIAHELNQPLSIIRTNMQTLDMFMLEQIPPEERKEIILSTLRQVERASTIIEHMRGFARKQTGKPCPINIAQAIKSAISMFNEQFRLHNISILHHQDNESIVIQSESQEIEQIIINLMTNAKFALEQKANLLDQKYDMQLTITVQYDDDNRQAILSVEDNGSGMSDETLAHCTEPFYTTKEMGQGTGLGLPITHSIVKKHHGNMHLSSILNQGTQVIIKLPAENKLICK